MFLIWLVKWVKSLIKQEPEDIDVVNYSEPLLPWMRKFVWLWLRYWRITLFFAFAGLPAAHYVGSGYGYTIGYFWVIYAPVCGLFFNYRHFDLDGEGPYYLNSGCWGALKRRLGELIGRF